MSNSSTTTVSTTSNNFLNKAVASEEHLLLHDQKVINSGTNASPCKEILDKHPGLKAKSPLEMVSEYIPPENLIEKTLVAGQPCIIAAPSKSMKTTIAIHMALSLALGEHFLYLFWIHRPVKVLFMCGKAEAAKLLSTLAASLHGMGESFESLQDNLWLTTEVPNAKNPETLMAFETQLDEYNPEVVIVDPLTLALNTEQADDQDQMRHIELLSKPCSDRGITFVAVAHICEGSREDRMRALANMTGGSKLFAEWMLINREGCFGEGPNRLHKLDIKVGGSLGHAWDLPVVILEEFKDRELSRIRCFIDDQDYNLEDLVDEETEESDPEWEEKVRNDCQKIISFLRKQPDGAAFTLSEIKFRLGFTEDDCDFYLGELEDNAEVIKVLDTVPQRNGKIPERYRLNPIFVEPHGTLPSFSIAN